MKQQRSRPGICTCQSLMQRLQANALCSNTAILLHTAADPSSTCCCHMTAVTASQSTCKNRDGRHMIAARTKMKLRSAKCSLHRMARHDASASTNAILSNAQSPLTAPINLSQTELQTSDKHAEQTAIYRETTPYAQLTSNPVHADGTSKQSHSRHLLTRNATDVACNTWISQMQPTHNGTAGCQCFSQPSPSNNKAIDPDQSQ
jgi:hypothetical protein